MNDPIWRSASETQPISLKIVEIAYQLRDDFLEMIKNRKRMILHFNSPEFY